VTELALPALPAVGTALSARQVGDIERRVIDAVESVEDLDELAEWRAQAAALEAYLRSRDLQRPMLGAARRIEGRIGQLLGEPKRGVPRDPTHKLVLSRESDGADFRLLAKALSGECPLTEDEWRKSRRALTSLVREKLGLMPETPELPDGQFACVVADPPWKLDTGPDVFGGTGEAGHDDLAYAQMSLGDIGALDVKSLAAPDAHLYLWTTNRYLRDSYVIAEEWGFKPSVLLAWCKTPRGVGLGDTYRLTTEYVLFARRGNLPHARVVPTTWFNWPRGRHSAKPADFYSMVESVTPGPYVDLFARTPREGWTVWGNEVS
jgi:N6-adenosine-specific RNA methylase IME4